MRIYFAGSWSRKHELSSVRDRMLLFNPFIESVSTWLDDPDMPHDRDGMRTFKQKQEDAIRDAQDVADCDVFILFTSDKPEYQVGGGRFWEFGRAYTLGKGCLVVGPQEQIFESMPCVVHLDSTQELFDNGMSYALLERLQFTNKKI